MGVRGWGLDKKREEAEVIVMKDEIGTARKPGNKKEKNGGEKRRKMRKGRKKEGCGLQLVVCLQHGEIRIEGKEKKDEKGKKKGGGKKVPIVMKNTKKMRKFRI